MGENSEVKRPRRAAARFFHVIMIAAYFLLFILALVSMSAFANVHLAIMNNDVYDVNNSIYGGCILNADYNSENSFPQYRLNNDTNSCNYAIVGEAIIATYALVAIAVMVIKIIAGTQFIGCFLVIELFVNFVALLGSLSVGLVISIGLSLTCGSLNDRNPDTTPSCSSLTVPESGSDTVEIYNTVEFYNRLNISQVSAWLAFTTLTGILTFYVLCICLYAYGRRKERHAREKMRREHLEKSGDEHEHEDEHHHE